MRYNPIPLTEQTVVDLPLKAAHVRLPERQLRAGVREALVSLVSRLHFCI
jgi:hypothetical protein